MTNLLKPMISVLVVYLLVFPFFNKGGGVPASYFFLTKGGGVNHLESLERCEAECVVSCHALIFLASS